MKRVFSGLVLFMIAQLFPSFCHQLILSVQPSCKLCGSCWEKNTVGLFFCHWLFIRCFVNSHCGLPKSRNSSFTWNWQEIFVGDKLIHFKRENNSQFYFKYFCWDIPLHANHKEQRCSYFCGHAQVLYHLTCGEIWFNHHNLFSKLNNILHILLWTSCSISPLDLPTAKLWLNMNKRALTDNGFLMVLTYVGQGLAVHRNLLTKERTY